MSPRQPAALHILQKAKGLLLTTFACHKFSGARAFAHRTRVVSKQQVTQVMDGWTHDTEL
jgi:hypothetical protein